MYPNKNVNLPQFYSVPAPTFSPHTYPYSLYIQPNHTMNIVSPPQKPSPTPCLDDVFANGPRLPRIGSTSAPNFQEFYRKQNVQESGVASLPKYFRCTLGEGPTRYRRERTVFTQNQLRIFEKRFEAQKYLSTKERFELARRLGLSPLQVKTWFQNRRMKWKKTAKNRQNSQNGNMSVHTLKEESQSQHIKDPTNQVQLSPFQ